MRIKAKVIIFPRYQSAKYEKYILSLINKTKKDIKEALVSFFVIHKDDYIDDLESLLSDLRSAIISNESILISDLIITGRSILKFTRKQLVDSLSGLLKVTNAILPIESLGVDVFNSPFNFNQNELLKSWVVTNTRLITSIEGSLLDDVATIIESGFRAGSSIDYMQDQIKLRFDVSDKKARLIARDQTAKLHSNYIRQEHLNLGISEYIWLTSNDERVRVSHELLHGKVCKWEDAEVYKNEQSSLHWLDKKDLTKKGISATEHQVGEDFQCRCSIKAIVNF